MTTLARQTDNKTRDTLIQAGIDLFGRLGYEATSTRALAHQAGANIAAISYHFGSKGGLRLACAEAIVHDMTARLDLAAFTPSGLPAETARASLLVLQQRFVTFFTSDERAETIARFVLRELASPSPAFALLFERLIAPGHTLICQLWGTATGTDPDSEATRLAVFAQMGSIAYFRIAKPVVTARMKWDDYSPQAAATIGAVLATQLNAALDASSKAFRERQ